MDLKLQQHVSFLWIYLAIPEKFKQILMEHSYGAYIIQSSAELENLS